MSCVSQPHKISSEVVWKPRSDFINQSWVIHRWNNDHLNHGLYHNRMLYLHGIRFFHPDYPLLESSDIQVVKTNSKVVDVIVVAAPNKREAVEHQGI